MRVCIYLSELIVDTVEHDKHGNGEHIVAKIVDISFEISTRGSDRTLLRRFCSQCMGWRWGADLMLTGGCNPATKFDRRSMIRTPSSAAAVRAVRPGVAEAALLSHIPCYTLLLSSS